MAADDLVNMFVNIPNTPSSLYPCNAAEYSIWPKLDIKVVAPAPNLVIKLSYIPRNDKKAPAAV